MLIQERMRQIEEQLKKRQVLQENERKELWDDQEKRVQEQNRKEIESLIVLHKDEPEQQSIDQQSSSKLNSSKVTFQLSEDESQSAKNTIKSHAGKLDVPLPPSSISSQNTDKQVSALEELCGLTEQPRVAKQDRIIVNRDLLKDLFSDQTKELEQSLRSNKKLR